MKVKANHNKAKRIINLGLVSRIGFTLDTILSKYFLLFEYNPEHHLINKF